MADWEEGVGRGDAPPFFKSDRILRDQVLLCLRKVIDPDLHQDIVACGFVKNLKFDYDRGSVSFTLELTTPSCPVKDTFVDLCTRYLKDLDWVKDVDITLDSQKGARDSAPTETRWLNKVRIILAVSSCKGGVGKSTLAVNLAYMLKLKGASVGIADVDVYGPSLNTLLPLEGATVYAMRDPEADPDSKQGILVPVEYDGIKLMSYSYIRQGGGETYAAVRGPIASSLALQMVCHTDWGELDYLIIDMPPGTGDVHLSLVQSVRINAAVVVTTPHKISLVDVAKGIRFFEEVHVPTVAVVENMAHLMCPSCKQKTRLGAPVVHLGSTGGCGCKAVDNETQDSDILSTRYSVGFTHSLPLDPYFGACCFLDADSNTQIFPYVKAMAAAPTYLFEELSDLADNVVREVSRVVYGDPEAYDVSTTPDGFLQMLMGPASGEQTLYLVPLRDIRLKCGCAECVDEVTRKSRLNPRLVPVDIHIIKLEQMNNYSTRITWSDGHQSLVPFRQIQELGDETKQTKGPSCANPIEW